MERFQKELFKLLKTEFFARFAEFLPKQQKGTRFFLGHRG
jgi:hypothetical protein